MDKKQIDPNKAAIARQLAILKRRAEKIQEAESRLARQSQELAWVQSTVAELGLSQGLSTREALAAINDKANKLKAVANSRGQQIQKLEARLASSSSTLSGVKKAVTTLTTSLQRRDKRIADLQAQIKSDGNQAKEKDEQLGSLQHLLVERENALGKTTQLVSAADRQIAEQRQQLDELNQGLALKQDELGRRNSELGELSTLQKQHQQESVGLKKQLTQSQQQLGQMHENVSSMIASIGKLGISVEGGLGMLANHISSHTSKLVTTLITTEAKVRELQDQLGTRELQAQNLENKASTLRASLQTQSAELIEKTKQLSDSKALGQKQFDELSHLNNQLNEVQKKSDQWKSASLSLDQQLAQRNSELAQNKKLLGLANVNVQTQTGELEALQTKLTRLEELAAKQTTAASHLEQQHSKLSEELSQKETEVNVSKVKIELYTKEMGALRRLVAERDNAQQQQNGQIASLNSQLKKLGTVHNHQHLQLSQFASQIKQKDQSLSQKDSEIKEAKVDLLKQEVDLQEHEEQLTQINLVMSGLEDQLDTLNTSLKQKTAELSASREEVASQANTLQVQKRQLVERATRQQLQEERLNSLVAQLDKQRNEANHKQKQLDALVAELKKKEGNLHQQLNEIEHAKTDIRNLQQVVSEKDERLYQENALFEAQKNQLDSMQSQLEKQIATSDRWRSRVASLESSFNSNEVELNQKIVELTNLETTVDNQNSQLFSQAEEITNLKKALEQRTQISRQQKSRLVELEDELKQTLHQFNSLEKEAETAREIAQASIESRDIKLKGLKEQVAQQETTLDEQNEQIGCLKTALQRQANEANNYKMQLSELADELKQKSSQLEKAIAENLEQHKTLREQEEQLAQNKPLFGRQESMIHRLQKQLETETAVADNWRSQVDSLESKVNSRGDEINQIVVKLGRVNASRAKQTAEILKLKEQLSIQKAQYNEQALHIESLEKEQMSIFSALGCKDKNLVGTAEQLNEQVSQLNEQLGVVTDRLKTSDAEAQNLRTTLQEMESDQDTLYDALYNESARKAGEAGKQQSSAKSTVVSIKPK